MKQALKNIYWIFDDYYRDYIAVNKVNPRTGISGKDKNKLAKQKTPKLDSITVFGKPFYFNNGGSLLHSIDEIFLEEVYKFPAKTENPIILDCGANIGLSMFYFNKIYPKSTIIVFEPDHELCNILKKNAEVLGNPNIQVLEKAVWHEDTQLTFFSQGALSGSLVTDFGRGNNTITVEAVDIRKYLQNKVDFLKIDIEGAENEIFFHIADSLENVDFLFLEYHSIKNEEQMLGEILNIIKKAGFQYYIKLASDVIRFPFMKEEPRNSFNMQLNIFCYRK